MGKDRVKLNEKMINIIIGQMRQKPPAELLALLSAHDENKYTLEAFEAMRRILDEQGIPIPARPLSPLSASQPPAISTAVPTSTPPIPARPLSPLPATQPPAISTDLPASTPPVSTTPMTWKATIGACGCAIVFLLVILLLVYGGVQTFIKRFYISRAEQAYRLGDCNTLSDWVTKVDQPWPVLQMSFRDEYNGSMVGECIAYQAAHANRDAYPAKGLLAYYDLLTLYDGTLAQQGVSEMQALVDEHPIEALIDPELCSRLYQGTIRLSDLPPLPASDQTIEWFCGEVADNQLYRIYFYKKALLGHPQEALSAEKLAALRSAFSQFYPGTGDYSPFESEVLFQDSDASVLSFSNATHQPIILMLRGEGQLYLEIIAGCPECSPIQSNPNLLSPFYQACDSKAITLQFPLKPGNYDLFIIDSEAWPGIVGRFEEHNFLLPDLGKIYPICYSSYEY